MLIVARTHAVLVVSESELVIFENWIELGMHLDMSSRVNVPRLETVMMERCNAWRAHPEPAQGSQSSQFR